MEFLTKEGKEVDKVSVPNFPFRFNCKEDPYRSLEGFAFFRFMTQMVCTCVREWEEGGKEGEEEEGREEASHTM